MPLPTMHSSVSLAFALVALALSRAPSASATGLRDPPLLGDGGAPLSLDGEGWVARSGDGALAVAATVPGDVVTDLWRGGIIGDPLLDANWRDQSGAWARAGGFRYERAFAVAPGSALDRAPSAPLRTLST